MQLIHEMPTEGQFIAIWEYNTEPWAMTLRIEDGEVLEYDADADAYRQVAIPLPDDIDIGYIVL